MGRGEALSFGFPEAALLWKNMKHEDKPRLRTCVFVFLAASILFAACFSILPSLSDQPPVDMSTYRFAMFGQPRRVDPSRAYDASSGELIFNVYETLVAFSDKRVLPPATTNVSAWGYSDLTLFQPVLAESLPIISSDRRNWTFTIRSGVKWHPWIAADGTGITDQYLKVEDVEYTFKRMLVQDMLGAPSWAFSQFLTGYQFFDSFDQQYSTNTIEPLGQDGYGERLVRDMINDAVTVNGNDITFHFADPWPENMVMQIFSQSWGCIVNKAFCVEHGCWSGTFYDGWSTDYRRMPSNSYSPLDRYYKKSKYPSDNPDVPAMCGTGPYKFTYWDKVIGEWGIYCWNEYRGGWVEPGTGPHSVRTVIATRIVSWPTRKMMFLSGQLDSIYGNYYDFWYIDGSNMMELLQGSDLYTPVQGITLYYAAPVLLNDAIDFVFDVDSYSPYVTKIQGIRKENFFGDYHVRRAFAHALNFTEYLMDVWGGEVIHPASWWVKGLAPDYESKTLVPHDINLTMIEDELKAAGVWDSGFETYIGYNAGNDKRRIASEMIKAVIQNLTTDGRFKVNVLKLDWPTYTDYEENRYLPVFFVGWTADFADPDNFVRVYMHGIGAPGVDELIDNGIRLPDGEERNQTYQELQYIYWNNSLDLKSTYVGYPYYRYDFPSLPLIQMLTRFWQRDWVRGWYYNPLYPGRCFYDLYKVNPELVPVDLSIVD